MFVGSGDLDGTGIMGTIRNRLSSSSLRNCGTLQMSRRVSSLTFPLTFAELRIEVLAAKRKLYKFVDAP